MNAHPDDRRPDVADALRHMGVDPTPDQVDALMRETGSVLPTDPATGEPVTAEEPQVVEALQAAHRDTEQHTVWLAEARQRRRHLAAMLHSRGRSYGWIGEQLGLTAQAVEGFVKYRERRSRRSAGDDG